MAGSATDDTENPGLREITERFETSLLLPLLTVPQVLVTRRVLSIAG